ncbi:hypothetical protein Zmor_025937 [Zophobas morio]|uniref:Uncharacterized protein n=1 Tax=Zophobas morio TaxID=2755281 RepID=A0AA38HSP1_9CUCU|nr:hypothetical protein Zmor_025937 [Zophobas morio]
MKNLLGPYANRARPDLPHQISMRVAVGGTTCCVFRLCGLQQPTSNFKLGYSVAELAMWLLCDVMGESCVRKLWRIKYLEENKVENSGINSWKHIFKNR